MGFLDRLASTSEYAQQELDNQVKKAQIQKYLAEMEAEKKKAAPTSVDAIFGIPSINQADAQKDQAMKQLFGAPSVGPLPELPGRALNEVQAQTPVEIATKRQETGITPDVGRLPLDQGKDLLSMKKSIEDAKRAASDPSKMVEFFNPKTLERSPTPKPGFVPDTTERINTFIANFEKEGRLQESKIESERRAAEKEKNKALSGDAAKVQAIAKTMIPEIGKLQQAFRDDYAGAVWGITTGTNRKLVKLAEQVADKVGRIRSGGAVNKPEEKRFMGQIASAMDIAFGKEGDAIAALDAIINEANEVMKGIRPNAGGTDEDSAAIAWAKANPTNPDAIKILELNGIKQ